MKKLLTILSLFVCLSLSGATYYVSTTGSDLAAGSFAAPWATWQKGFSTIVAGDTLYIRGGTYQPAGTSIGVVFSTEWFGCVALDGHNGTALNRIVVMNYEDEIPILDGVNNTAANNGGPGSRFGIVLRRCDYWTLKGLNVTGVVQLEGELGVAGIRFQENADHNEIIECNVYSCGGSGISFLYNCTDNLIYNCDSYDNYDHLSVPTPGNNSDGIEIADITDTSAVNTIRGCRLWDNSDDGIDLMRNEGNVIIDSTWAFYNGITADYPATGFKLGQTSDTVTAVSSKRKLTNCISAYNNSAGIFANVSYQIMEVYNCLVIGNGSHGVHWYIGTEGAPSIIKNNISIYNTNYNYSYIYNSYDFEYNTYSQYDETRPVCDSTDFVTLDTLGMRFSRKANGCLPDINFGKLASTSDMIDAGTDVGIDYVGTAPDLGPFEYRAPSVIRAATTRTGRLAVSRNGHLMVIY